MITGVALSVGISLSVAAYGLSDGMTTELLRALTKFDLGHVQIHNPHYPKLRKVGDTLANSPALVAAARRVKAVRGASPRVYGYALVSHGDKSLGVELVGVDPRTEPQVTSLHQQLTEGRYLDVEPTPWRRGRALTAAEKARDAALTRAAEDDAMREIDALGDDDDDGGADKTATPATRPPGDGAAASDSKSVTSQLARALSPSPDRPPRVFVGATLAKLLKAKVGDKIYATAPTIDGTTGNVVLELSGIFRTGTAVFDRTRIYMHVTDLQHLMHLYDRVHEIAIIANRPDNARSVARAIAKDPATAGTLVRPWQTIRPDIKKMIDTTTASMLVMVFIILFVATLGVVNTMLMAVFERSREFGVLKALGMSGVRIVALLVVETTLLVLAASAVGTAIGLGLDYHMLVNGIDLSGVTDGFSMGGVGVNPVFHGAITVRGVVTPSIVLAITCFLASFYPAIRAARKPAAVGMRET